MAGKSIMACPASNNINQSMKQFFFLCIFLVSLTTTAQKFEISGKLVDKENGAPLESATIFVERPADSTLVTYTITDKEGNFVLEGSDNSEALRLVASYAGYVPFNQSVKLTPGKINLGVLQLEFATNLLGEVTVVAAPEAVDALIPLDLEIAIGELTGAIQQVPSSVSAIKVDGKRAYARARDGEVVELAPRTVTVSAFDIIGHELVAEHTTDGPRQYWDVSVRVECSSGTYIRALARDLGAALGVGGHLTSLRRTRVGPFDVEHATSIEELKVDSLLSPASVATTLFPSHALDAQQALDLEHGKRIDAPKLAERAQAGYSGPVAAIAPDGRLVGLIEPIGQQGKVLVNFPVDQGR